MFLTPVSINQLVAGKQYIIKNRDTQTILYNKDILAVYVRPFSWKNAEEFDRFLNECIKPEILADMRNDYLNDSNPEFQTLHDFVSDCFQDLFTQYEDNPIAFFDNMECDGEIYEDEDDFVFRLKRFSDKDYAFYEVPAPELAQV